MLRCIQSCHSGKCNDGIGWSIFLRRFKKAFLVVILHDLRKQSLRFTKPGNLLGVAMPLWYTVEEIVRMLAISLRSAYNLCNNTTEFRVLRVGGSIRVPKDSFDAWLYRAA